jgi:hypothetical protein
MVSQRAFQQLIFSTGPPFSTAEQVVFLWVRPDRKIAQHLFQAKVLPMP